mmetsp:Transcript_19288/g.28813  ORF Transcript_19288/g.28813 Transcript_19288/m.28813 type:complete len:182 (-) Transcript_19288:268-813(-)
MLLRKGLTGMSVIKRSTEQQHGWNHPFQLVQLPPELSGRSLRRFADGAEDGDRYRCEVHVGDLVLMFTDGFRDNLHDHEILSIVDRTISPAFSELVGLHEHSTPPEVIARALAIAALARSLDPKAKVPFSLYSRQHGFDLSGGKEDDITVLAAWVVPDGGSTIPAVAAKTPLPCQNACVTF